MADISLEDLMAQKAASSSEEKPAEEVKPEVEIVKVTQAVETLTPEEKAKVQSIKDGINLMDSSTPLTFGAPAQKEIAEFSDSILSKVRTKDSGQVGELLTDLVSKVRGFDVGEKKSFVSKIPILGSLVEKGESVMQGYEKLSVHVERIQAGLEPNSWKMSSCSTRSTKKISATSRICSCTFARARKSLKKCAP